MQKHLEKFELHKFSHIIRGNLTTPLSLYGTIFLCFPLIHIHRTDGFR